MQVYQPSEEELRGYLDPYENVMCTECQQGGDDALMLLCDLCDSPAHTYCVGLGHEVPEGNWYCEGCRPTAALDSSNPQSLNPTPGYRASNNLSSSSPPVANIRETFDLNEVYVPDTPATPVPGLLSPRLSVGDSQAFTVLERRRIQHQIRQMINHRRLQDYESNGAVPPFSGNSIVGSQLGRGRVLVPQHTLMPERTVAPYISPFRGQIHENSAGTLPLAEGFPARLNHFRGPVMQGQASTSADGSFGGLMQNEAVDINVRVGYGSGLQQIQPCSSRSNIGSETSSSVHPCREVSPFNVEKEQLQSMVRSHLKRFSQDLDLGMFKFPF